MKPIIIILNEDEVKLTKAEFEKYIQQAYDNGVEDGRASIKYYYNYPRYYGGAITTGTPINKNPATVSSSPCTSGSTTLGSQLKASNEVSTVNFVSSSNSVVTESMREELTDCLSNIRKKAKRRQL